MRARTHTYPPTHPPTHTHTPTHTHWGQEGGGQEGGESDPLPGVLLMVKGDEALECSLCLTARS